MTWTSSKRYCSTTSVPFACIVLSRARISSSRSPWSTASSSEASLRRTACASSEVLGHRQHDRARSRSGDLVVPVEHVLIDGDRRERGRVDSWGCGPSSTAAAGVVAAGDAGATGSPPRAARRHRRGRRHAARSAAAMAAAGSSGRASAGWRRRSAGRRAARPSCRTRSSAAPSGGCRSPRPRRRTRRGPRRPAGTVFGSVIMKNRKISSSGENMTTRQ